MDENELLTRLAFFGEHVENAEILGLNVDQRTSILSAVVKDVIQTIATLGTAEQDKRIMDVIRELAEGQLKRELEIYRFVLAKHSVMLQTVKWKSFLSSFMLARLIQGLQSSPSISLDTWVQRYVRVETIDSDTMIKLISAETTQEITEAARQRVIRVLLGAEPQGDAAAG